MFKNFYREYIHVLFNIVAMFFYFSWCLVGTEFNLLTLIAIGIALFIFVKYVSMDKKFVNENIDKLKDKKMIFRKYAISGENIGYAVFTNFLLFLLYLGISVYFKDLSVISLLFAFILNVSLLMLTLKIMSRFSLKNRDV
ncbi:RND transporter [Bacillus thuringiensis serovar brasilensis]|uniref:RND transporter n=1 Tax=Bacillus cereus group TaxID=86661 RepID=UPI000A3849E6|nr:RND transporter [Bacillus thuringiensis]MDY7954714.1 RND transporter [Bacillus thuringiensis]MRA75524.1 RND transporter [Bacillus thuringiensis]MRA94017.1 RND transporter [Bacillus thuringiensis]MRC56736.1 RND transporter [Bacillus thuringiensis]OTX39631.1 RND transporter [Bacillus thuringiensis serovar brasilensis]